MRAQAHDWPARGQSVLVDGPPQDLITDQLPQVGALPSLLGKHRVSARQGLDAASEAVGKIGWIPSALQCLLGNGLHICKGVLDAMVQLVEQQALRIGGLHLIGNVVEVADHAEVAVGELNSVDAPVVIFRHPSIGTDFGPLLGDIGLAGCQRVPEDAHDLVGIVSFPNYVNCFVEIPPNDTPRDITEHRQGRGVGVPNSEVGVDQVRLPKEPCTVVSRIEQRCRAKTELYFGAIAPT